MEQNEELEMQVFQIISAVGTARSCYIEAIHAAKDRDYEQAAELLKKEMSLLPKVMILIWSFWDGRLRERL